MENDESMENGDKAMFTILCEAGASFERNKSGHFPLHWTGQDSHAIYPGGKSPVQSLVKQGQLQILDKLLKFAKEAIPEKHTVGVSHLVIGKCDLTSILNMWSNDRDKYCAGLRMLVSR